MNTDADPVVALAAEGLSKRYGASWALRECSLSVPSGHVVALVGPNGAGKTTFLHLAVGLATASAGRVSVLGGHAAGSPAARAGVSFVAQDAALYANLSVAHTIQLARNLNTGFDADRARARTAELGIPLDRKVGKLSGGQRAQVALSLALAKRPRLLILDEPMASLDPLARHEFTASLMAAVAEDGISVIYSSHVVAELERVADYLVLLTEGRVQVAGEVDDLLATHRVYTGPADQADQVAQRLPVVREQRAESQAHLLVRTRGPHADAPADWEVHQVGLEELVLAYLRKPNATAFPEPRALTGKGTQP